MNQAQGGNTIVIVIIVAILCCLLGSSLTIKWLAGFANGFSEESAKVYINTKCPILDTTKSSQSEIDKAYKMLTTESHSCLAVSSIGLIPEFSPSEIKNYVIEKCPAVDVSNATPANLSIAYVTLKGQTTLDCQPVYNLIKPPSTNVVSKYAEF